MPYWFPIVVYFVFFIYMYPPRIEMKLKVGGKSPPTLKKKKILQKDERMVSLSLSLSLFLSVLSQVNMSAPNIGKHAGQTCWTCSLWNDETKPVIFIQTFTKEITSIIFSPLDKDNLQLLWLCSQQTCLKSHGWL